MKICVNTDKPYEIKMDKGLLYKIGAEVEKLKKACKVCIVTDNIVHPLYTPPLERSLIQSGFDVFKAVFSNGEEVKSMNNFKALLEYLVSQNFDKGDLLIALGGGTVGDLTGFAASVYHRGMDFVQVPTTLLASVDSSVGGKTAINLNQGKNLVGSFWQPLGVFIDPLCFETLKEKDMLNGIAETVKAGIIADEVLFHLLATTRRKELASILEKAIKRAIIVKADIVSGDEKEEFNRQLLNLGHTLAHSLEKLSGFEIAHGLAVALGILVISKAAHSMGWCEEDLSIILSDFYRHYGFDFSPIIGKYSPAELAEAAQQDKKKKGNQITLSIPVGLGKCILKTVPLNLLENIFEEGFRGLGGQANGK